MLIVTPVRVVPKSQAWFWSPDWKMRGHDAFWELTRAADGRATLEFGSQHRPGEAHVVWRRLGTHSVFDRP